MNWRCDVYVYEAADGFVTHVAGRRREGIKRPCPGLDMTTEDSFIDSYKNQMAWLDPVNEGSLWKWVDVVEEYASRTYVHETAGDCAANLILLKAAGVVVPQHAIDELINDARIQDAGSETGDDNSGGGQGPASSSLH